METQQVDKQPQTLNAYLWPTLRTSVILSWIALVLCALTVYLGFLYWLKSESLNSKLSIANATISEAVSIGDWDYALRALLANSAASEIYSLTLASANGSALLAGPLGIETTGIASVCSEKFLQVNMKLSGCMKIVGPAELVEMTLFVLVTSVFSFISLTVLRNRSLGLFDKVSRFLTDENSGDSEILEIEQIRGKIAALISEKVNAQKDREISELATQVAHDIRSPLSALRMVSASLKNLEGEKSELIQRCTTRIEEIANKLLNQHQQNLIKELSLKDVQSILHDAISEKTASYERSRISLQVPKSQDTPNAVFRVQLSELRSIASNLLNNSIEASEETCPIVNVSMEIVGSRLEISLTDNGGGIPAEILSKLGKARGNTYGKARGSGLGLFHARTSVESWGGELRIDSQIGVGTIVTLCLPMFENSNRKFRRLSEHEV